MSGNEAAREQFDSYSSYQKLEEVIRDGQTESLYLECKSHQDVHLNKGAKNKLAEALSGFSNTEGGVYVLGVSTSDRVKGLDVLTQIEPIPSIDNFRRRVENVIPTLTIPNVTRFQTKVLKKRPRDSAGIMLVYIPRHGSKPVQSEHDSHFHFRSGDEFINAPYSVLEQLFAASDSPSLEAVIERTDYDSQTKKHKIALIAQNRSLGAALYPKSFIEFKNSASIESFTPPSDWSDVSKINSNRKTFVVTVKEPIYYGLGMHLGECTLKLKPRTRKLSISISLFSQKMVPIEQVIELHLTKSKLQVTRNDVRQKV